MMFIVDSIGRLGGGGVGEIQLIQARGIFCLNNHEADFSWSGDHDEEI